MGEGKKTWKNSDPEDKDFPEAAYFPEDKTRESRDSETGVNQRSNIWKTT